MVTKPSRPQIQLAFATVGTARNPLGLVGLSPVTKAALSCSAKAASISSASQRSMSTTASSRSVWVAAGMA